MSSSSSESDCDEYWQYGIECDRTYRNTFGRNPFLQTMGHPLIYYAQVPQPICIKQRGRERQRNNPNCFVKAFRWYTQEHVPNRSVSPTTKPDMAGFAVWLDTKYDQFLEESQNRQDLCDHVKVKQTSVIQTNRIYHNDCCEECATKKFRVKSPWKRRRRAKSNDTGDERQKSNQSFQYILQPKDTSRAVSECCHPSTVTVLSEPKRTVVKSRSFSNITVTNKDQTKVSPAQEGTEMKKNVKEISACQNVEIKTTNENATNAKCKPATQDFSCQYCENKCMKDAETQYYVIDSSVTLGSVSTHQSELNNECGCQVEKKTQHPSQRVANVNAPKASKSYVDNYCQCPEEKVVHADAQTQYEVCDTRCECDFKEFVRHNPPPIQSTSKVNKECSCQGMVEEELQYKPVPAAVRFSQNTAQTSNHSIHLDKQTNQYPLFMKIVCADKLNEDTLK